MGVGGVESNVSVENGSNENNLNGGLVLNEPIKFGTHGSDEPIRVEASNIPEDNFPKDAADEWPEAKQTHSFYFVKFRSLDDPKLKAKLDQADKDLQRLNQARFQIIEKLRVKRADRSVVIAHLKALGVETTKFRGVMDEKRKEMEPLQQALGKLRGSNNAGRVRGSFICSSQEELNDLIKSLHYRIQHESIPLSEEKQILRDIKQLEGTRDQVLAKAAEAAEIQGKMGQKEAIQDQVKLIGAGLDGVRKDRQVVKAKVKHHEDEKAVIDNVIRSLEAELDIATDKRNKAFEKIQELRKQREEGNACFYENRSLFTKVRDLASKKDIEALKELSASEVDKFMSLWSSTKDFRDDYEKRILPSLDIRQLSRDGRMRNPGEKPLVSQEAPTPSETEVLVKPKAKQTKEDDNTAPVQKEKNSNNQKEASTKTKGTTVSTLHVEDKEEEVFELEKKVEKHSQKTKEVDEAKLKEMKREEEAAKAKQAMERKKKLAEKAEAKAAAKAQKEAEKKLKEREKKAKKKMQASASVPEPEEATEAAAVETDEPKKAIDENVTAPVPSKRKENTTRHRRQGKGPESISKVILKRKKSTNYWYWAVPVTVCVLVLLVIGYKYL